jgi:hypothetical protein
LETVSDGAENFLNPKCCFSLQARVRFWGIGMMPVSLLRQVRIHHIFTFALARCGLWLHWQLGSYLPTAVRSVAESLKDLSQDEHGRIFLKISVPHSLITTYQMKLPFSKIHLDGQYL